MVRVPLFKSATVLFDRVCVQIFLTEVFQYSSIHRACQVRICKHTVHLLTRTMIITIKVTSISACIGVKPTIHRPQASVNPWNIEEQEIRTIKLSYLHIIFFQQCYVHYCFVVHVAEEVLLIFLDLFFSQPIWIELIIFFFNTEDDSSTIRIGKRRICFPKRMRKSPFRRLKFQVA